MVYESKDVPARIQGDLKFVRWSDSLHARQKKYCGYIILHGYTQRYLTTGFLYLYLKNAFFTNVRRVPNKKHWTNYYGHFLRYCISLCQKIFFYINLYYELFFLERHFRFREVD